MLFFYFTVVSKLYFVLILRVFPTISRSFTGKEGEKRKRKDDERKLSGGKGRRKSGYGRSERSCAKRGSD